jgi:hypothetical protein
VFNFNEHIGDLFVISLPSTSMVSAKYRTWPLMDNKGCTIKLLENNELVVLLDHKPEKRISANRVLLQGTAKVLCREGNIGYIASKHLVLLPEKGMNHE